MSVIFIVSSMSVMTPIHFAFAPNTTWGQAQNWRPSGEPGGSPGADDPIIPVTLRISSLNESTVSVAWSANAGGVDLYSAASLSSPIHWSRVTNAPVLSNDQWIVTLSPLTNGASFYRLQAQSGNGQ